MSDGEHDELPFGSMGFVRGMKNVAAGLSEVKRTISPTKAGVRAATAAVGKAGTDAVRKGVTGAKQAVSSSKNAVRSAPSVVGSLLADDRIQAAMGNEAAQTNIKVKAERQRREVAAQQRKAEDDIAADVVSAQRKTLVRAAVEEQREQQEAQRAKDATSQIVSMIDELRSNIPSVATSVVHDYAGDPPPDATPWASVEVQEAAHAEFLIRVGVVADGVAAARVPLATRHAPSKDDDRAATAFARYLSGLWAGDPADVEGDKTHASLAGLYGSGSPDVSRLLAYAVERAGKSISGGSEVIRLTRHLYVTSPWAVGCTTSLSPDTQNSVFADATSGLATVHMSQRQLVSMLSDTTVLSDTLEFNPVALATDRRAAFVEALMKENELDLSVSARSYVLGCVERFRKGEPYVPPDDSDALAIESVRVYAGEFFARRCLTGVFYFASGMRIARVDDAPVASDANARQALLKRARAPGAPARFTLAVQAATMEAKWRDMVRPPWQEHTIDGDVSFLQRLSMRYTMADPCLLIDASITSKKVVMRDVLDPPTEEDFRMCPITMINGKRIVSFRDVSRIMVETQKEPVQMVSFRRRLLRQAESGFFFGNVGELYASVHIPPGAATARVLAKYLPRVSEFETDEARFNEFLFEVRDLLPAFRGDARRARDALDESVPRALRMPRASTIGAIVETSSLDVAALSTMADRTLDAPFPGLRMQLSHASIAAINRSEDSMVTFRSRQNEIRPEDVLVFSRMEEEVSILEDITPLPLEIRQIPFTKPPQSILEVDLSSTPELVLDALRNA